MVIRTPNQILGNNGSKKHKKMKQNRRCNKEVLGKRIIVAKWIMIVHDDVCGYI